MLPFPEYEKPLTVPSGVILPSQASDPVRAAESNQIVPSGAMAISSAPNESVGKGGCTGP